MREFFDRKTFDPFKNDADRKSLNVLRAYGGSRQVASKALEWVLNRDYPKGWLVDLGCGDSRDYLVARQRGFEVWRVDLFPPRIDRPDITEHDCFIQGDVAEKIPLVSDSVEVALSQAVLDLIEPVAREGFYREVHRVLAPGGMFSCYMQWLQPGWGFDAQEEFERVRRVFSDVTTIGSQGFVARKENV